MKVISFLILFFILISAKSSFIISAENYNNTDVAISPDNNIHFVFIAGPESRDIYKSAFKFFDFEDKRFYVKSDIQEIIARVKEVFQSPYYYIPCIFIFIAFIIMIIMSVFLKKIYLDNNYMIYEMEELRHNNEFILKKIRQQSKQQESHINTLNERIKELEKQLESVNNVSRMTKMPDTESTDTQYKN